MKTRKVFRKLTAVFLTAAMALPVFTAPAAHAKTVLRGSIINQDDTMSTADALEILKFIVKIPGSFAGLPVNIGDPNAPCTKANCDNPICLNAIMAALEKCEGLNCPNPACKSGGDCVGDCNNPKCVVLPPKTNDRGFDRGQIPADAFRLNLSTLTREAARSMPGNDVPQDRKFDFNHFNNPDATNPDPFPNMLSITRGGTYVISGNLEADSAFDPAKGNYSGGQIYINAFKRPRDETKPRELEKVVLILDGVRLRNNYGPTIYIRRAAEVEIILVDGTTNRLRDYVGYQKLNDGDDDTGEIEPNGTIFSQCNLTIYGKGTLNIDGSERHGIATRDYLTIEGGTFNITTNVGNRDQGNGIHGRDGVIIRGGNFTIKAGNNGIRSNNIRNAHRSDREGGLAPTYGVVRPKFTTAHDSGFILITGGRFDIEAANGMAMRAVYRGEQNPNSKEIISQQAAGGIRIVSGDFNRMFDRMSATEIAE